MKYDVKVQFLSIVLMSLIIFQVKTDIPVHCLKSQVYIKEYYIFKQKNKKKTKN